MHMSQFTTCFGLRQLRRVKPKPSTKAGQPPRFPDGWLCHLDHARKDSFALTVDASDAGIGDIDLALSAARLMVGSGGQIAHANGGVRNAGTRSAHAYWQTRTGSRSSRVIRHGVPRAGRAQQLSQPTHKRMSCDEAGYGSLPLRPGRSGSSIRPALIGAFSVMALDDRGAHPRERLRSHVNGQRGMTISSARNQSRSIRDRLTICRSQPRWALRGRRCTSAISPRQ